MNAPVNWSQQSPVMTTCAETLPADWYFSAEQFEREVAAVFRRHWIMVGRSNEQQPMSMRRVEVGGENLIVVKDQAGAFTAFHNTCRHRGAELCRAAEARLTSKLITCPYHAWGYDLGGKLQRTPFVTITPDFRKEDHALFPVQVREWNGFVFVCLADVPPEFEAAFDVGSKALDNWPMDTLVTGHTLKKEIACNWKVFWENYNECLHCPGIHPMLCDTVPIYGRGYMAPNEAPDWSPEATAPEAVLKPGAATWTISGKPCGPQFPRLTDAERAAGQTFVTMLPTMYVTAHLDYVRAVSLRPLSPERTELTARWLFPAETLAALGFDLDDVVRFATTVISEDSDACEMNQRGLKSSKFRHGTLMPQEYLLHQFHQWVRRALEAAG